MINYKYKMLIHLTTIAYFFQMISAYMCYIWVDMTAICYRGSFDACMHAFSYMHPSIHSYLTYLIVCLEVLFSFLQRLLTPLDPLPVT